MFMTNAMDLMEDPEVWAFYETIIEPYRERIRHNQFWVGGDVEGQRVLDVGAGHGEQAEFYRNKGAEVVTLDKSVKLAVHCGKNGASVIADALSLPFRDNTFDLASCSMFMHSLNPIQQKKVIEEMQRVARRVVLTDYTNKVDPVYTVISNFFEEMEGHQDMKHYTSYLIYTGSGGIDNVVRKYKVVKEESCNGGTIKSVLLEKPF